MCVGHGCDGGSGTDELAVGSGPAVGSIATPAAALDSQLNLIEMEMMGAVKAMPAEKFGFAPSAAIFRLAENGVRHGTHVCAAGDARGRGKLFSASLVSGQQPDPKIRAVEKLTSKDDVVAALADSFAYAHKAIATITPANAFEVIKSPEPGFATRATLAGFLISHANDHYGQMVEYLRMNGLVPPASAK